MSAARYFVAWVVMLVLLGLSIWSAFLRIGPWQPLVQFGIAVTQTAIVFIVFMRLPGRPSLKWVFAGAGFFWLIFLYGLSMADYLTRSGLPRG